MNDILEIKRINKEKILPNANVTFDITSLYSEKITYDPDTGEIILKDVGQYTIRWWITTETTLTGCIKLALKSTQDDIIESCSPSKRGQLTGFGAIDAKTAMVRLSLTNIGDYPIILSQIPPVTAAILVMRIPEDGAIPSFDVHETITLPSESKAVVDMWEDVDPPNNWLFSFGIPKGETGVSGITPHIDENTGNWFIGDNDTNVHAQGAQGPKGDPGQMGMPEYYNFQVTSANTINNPVNYNIGNIRLAFSYYNATTLHLRLFPATPGVGILYDYRRLSFYDSTLQVGTQNGATLLDVGWVADDTIYSQSNEWQSTLLRQRNPDGTWSLCEYKLFGSASLSRITLWINWIYKDITVNGWY